MAKKPKRPGNQIDAADLAAMGPAARASVMAQMAAADAQQEAAEALEEAAESVKRTAEKQADQASSADRPQSNRERIMEYGRSRFEEDHPQLTRMLSAYLGVKSQQQEKEEKEKEKQSTTRENVGSVQRLDKVEDILNESNIVLNSIDKKMDLSNKYLVDVATLLKDIKEAGGMGGGSGGGLLDSALDIASEVGGKGKRALGRGARAAGRGASKLFGSGLARGVGGAALGGAFEAYDEYQESGNVGKAASAGVGGAAGGGAGAWIGGALGALGGPLAPVTVPLGALAGGAIGSWLGGKAGKGLYDAAASTDAAKQYGKGVFGEEGEVLPDLELSSNRSTSTTQRSRDVAGGAVETPVYDALGGYMGGDVKVTQDQKAGISQTSLSGISNQKSLYGSTGLGAALTAKGKVSGSFMGTKSQMDEFTDGSGKTDFDDFFGQRISGGIFGKDKYQVIWKDKELDLTKSEYFTIKDLVDNGDINGALDWLKLIENNETNRNKTKPVAKPSTVSTPAAAPTTAAAPISAAGGGTSTTPGASAAIAALEQKQAAASENKEKPNITGDITYNAKSLIFNADSITFKVNQSQNAGAPAAPAPAAGATGGAGGAGTPSAGGNAVSVGPNTTIMNTPGGAPGAAGGAGASGAAGSYASDYGAGIGGAPSASELGVRQQGGPNVAAGAVAAKPQLTTVRTKSGKSVQVGAAYASNFQGFINDLEATGYKINSIGGYADRPNVNNPKVKSYHAMGAAIDINPGANPNKSTKTDLPPETGALAAKWGLGWGMNWRSVKDPMHFSAAKGEQGSFDIPRGGAGSQMAAGEVQGGAATGGGGGEAKLAPAASGAGGGARAGGGGAGSLASVGGMLGGPLGGLAGGLLGSIMGAGGESGAGMVGAAPSSGAQLASASAQDQMDQRSSKGALAASQGGSETSATAPKGKDVEGRYDSSNPGNVEPVDARKRFAELFGMMA